MRRHAGYASAGGRCDRLGSGSTERRVSRGPCGQAGYGHQENRNHLAEAEIPSVSARSWNSVRCGPGDCRRTVAAPVKTADRPALVARRRRKAGLTPPALRRHETVPRTMRSGRRYSSDASRQNDQSAEGERKRLHARIEKLDLELSISDGLLLPDALIQPLLGHRAVALVVDVNSVSSARRLPIDQHAKSHGGSLRRWSHDEIKIAGVKAVWDPSVGL